MFKTRLSLLNTISKKRFIHTSPKLPHQDEFLTNGIPGLYSIDGFKTAWIDYQNFLTNRLTTLTNGTADETRYPLSIALIASKDQTRQKVFNIASQTFNNHFFFQQLIPSLINPSKPSRNLETRINEKFGSLDGLKQEFINQSEEILGQGWIFLVENENKELYLQKINNSGSPFYFGGNLSLDLNGPISEDDYLFLEATKQNVKEKKEDYSLPLLGISLWDQSYLVDYGVKGRNEYINKVFDSINWDVINKRVFAL